MDEAKSLGQEVADWIAAHVGELTDEQVAFVEAAYGDAPWVNMDRIARELRKR